jgi:transcriptional regulator
VLGDLTRFRSLAVHRPHAFRVDDRARLEAVIDAHPFALLVGPGLVATPLPLLRDGPEHLAGHLAAANPQARALAPGVEVLAVFQGPHAYVSPRWYAAARAVPTWNYVTVQVRGRVETVDPPATREAMRTMVDHFEGVERSRTVVAEDVIEGMVAGVRAFRLRIEALEGVFKLSQNRSAEDRAGVAAALRASGDESARAIAALMDADPAPEAS